MRPSMNSTASRSATRPNRESCSHGGAGVRKPSYVHRILGALPSNQAQAMTKITENEATMKALHALPSPQDWPGCTDEEFRELQAEFGLTNAEIAALIGTTERTVGRWASGNPDDPKIDYTSWYVLKAKAALKREIEAAQGARGPSGQKKPRRRRTLPTDRS